MLGRSGQSGALRPGCTRSSRWACGACSLSRSLRALGPRMLPVLAQDMGCRALGGSLAPISTDGVTGYRSGQPNRLLASRGEGLPAGNVIDWSIDWLAPSVIQVVWIGEERFKSLRSATPLLPPGARVLVGVDKRGLAGEGASKGSAEPAADLYPVPDALIDQPSWQAFMEDRVSWLNSEGDKNHLSGPVLQAVWSESLRRGHWLTPLAPLPTMALAAGLGVLLAAALERRRHRLLALALISLLAVPVSLELALSLRVLVPMLFPLGALWASCLSRQERDG